MVSWNATGFISLFSSLDWTFFRSCVNLNPRVRILGKRKLESVWVEMVLFNVVLESKTGGLAQQFLPKHHAIALGKLHSLVYAPMGTAPKKNGQLRSCRDWTLEFKLLEHFKGWQGTPRGDRKKIMLQQSKFTCLVGKRMLYPSRIGLSMSSEWQESWSHFKGVFGHFVYLNLCKTRCHLCLFFI